MDNPEGDINSSKGSGIQRNKKPAVAKNSPVLDFDFAHPPNSAVWVLSDADEDTWTPFIGGKKVPEHEKQKWADAFASLNTAYYGEKKS
uniref:Uncharacterized protein n=1 Tax=Rhizophora mucronata TaxID=61149 RepID=A0A2P2N9U9_RHIMU